MYVSALWVKSAAECQSNDNIFYKGYNHCVCIDVTLQREHTKSFFYIHFFVFSNSPKVSKENLIKGVGQL